MTGKPFWTMRVHDKRDVLIARHKARQVAHLLHFPPLQEACIAAGCFAIAAQGRDYYEICEVCFQLESRHLQIYARPLNAESGSGSPATNASVPQASACDGLGHVVNSSVATRLDAGKSAPPMKLAKPLPEAACDYSADELAFLIGRIANEAPADLFGELGRQNQEILLLLHMLQHPRDQLTGDAA